MKVTVEQQNILARQAEVVAFEEKATGTLDECCDRLSEWFKNDSRVVVGRGGHHVFVTVEDSAYKKRVLLIEEDAKHNR